MGLGVLLWIGGVGGPIYARGNHIRSRTARSALNLVQHYIVTSHAAGLNIAWWVELNGSVGYNLVASSFRQGFRLRATLNQWFMRALVGGVSRPAVYRMAVVLLTRFAFFLESSFLLASASFLQLWFLVLNLHESIRVCDFVFFTCHVDLYVPVMLIMIIHDFFDQMLFLWSFCC